MRHESHAKRTVTSWEYIKDNFEPSDRLAVVIKRRQKDVQRLVTAEQSGEAAIPSLAEIRKCPGRERR